jgi:hypothetical protein
LSSSIIAILRPMLDFGHITKNLTTHIVK